MIERPDAEAIVSGLRGRWAGDHGTCHCPAHDDGTASLSVSVSNGTVLVHCHAGCSQASVLDALRARALWPDGAVKDRLHGAGHGAGGDCLHRAAGERTHRAVRKPKVKKARKPGTSVFEYQDQTGATRFEVVREDCADGTKRFLQRRRDAEGRVIYNMSGVELLPYKLPQLIKGIEAGATIYIVEGERKVDLLERWGLTATCNPGGAGKWKSAFAEFFKARRIPVVVLSDNDDAGQKHGRQVAESLAPWADSIKVIDLPNLKAKGDIVDWMAAGGDKRFLLDIVAAMPPWAPDAASPEPEPTAEAEPGAVDDGAEGAPPEPEEGSAPSEEPADELEEDRAPAFSVEALALDFAAKHAAELRYVAEWSRWFRWRRSRWAVDSILWAFRMARVACRAAAAGADDKRTKLRLTDGKTEAAVERLARADPRLAAEVDRFDPDPLTFNMEATGADH
jgi:putative DNA primase/helicase